MSFLADKKREHEAIAEAALSEKNYAKAFFHTGKAAEFGLKIAEQSEGKIAERYVEDAFALIDIASKMKEKARAQGKDGVNRVMKEAAAGNDAEEPAPGSSALVEKPSMKLDDVAGLDDVKDVLREKVIFPFQKPEVFERFRAASGAGILMYGPPGNGKTYIAKAIAGEVEAAFFAVDLSQVKSKYVGETAKNIKRVFDEASGHDRAVLFLDEVESLLARRGNRAVDSVAQFLTLADGFNRAKNCMLLLAATNRPWALDEAVLRPGRLGTHIYVGLPDTKAREAIFGLTLKGLPVATDVSFDQLSQQTEGYSGADVAALCDRAKMAAILRQLASEKDEQITAADFSAVLEKVKPSTSPDLLKDFERWRDKGARPNGQDDED
jgi:transitional endoplasmic reticulum ATPase